MLALATALSIQRVESGRLISCWTWQKKFTLGWMAWHQWSAKVQQTALQSQLAFGNLTSPWYRRMKMAHLHMFYLSNMVIFFNMPYGYGSKLGTPIIGID